MMRFHFLGLMLFVVACGTAGNGGDAGSCPTTLPGPAPDDAGKCPVGDCYRCTLTDEPESCNTTFCSSTYPISNDVCDLISGCAADASAE